MYGIRLLTPIFMKILLSNYKLKNLIFFMYIIFKLNEVQSTY